MTKDEILKWLKRNLSAQELAGTASITTERKEIA